MLMEGSEDDLETFPGRCLRVRFHLTDSVMRKLIQETLANSPSYVRATGNAASGYVVTPHCAQFMIIWAFMGLEDRPV